MRTALFTIPMFVPIIVALAACASEQTAAPVTPVSTTSAVAGDQVSDGKNLYVAHCASCHGKGGEGSAKAPAVVGAAALPMQPPVGAKLRTVPFHTAADIFAWIKQNMPRPSAGSNDAPGSLTDEQYAAILAFDLKVNGITLPPGMLDSTSAASIVLHP